MISSRTIEMALPPVNMLFGFKQYASVPDDSRDELLSSLLRSAVDKVQECADESIVAATREVVVTEREENRAVKLYQSVDEIVSVTDGHGRDIPYTRRGRSIIAAVFTQEIIVRYTTKPDCGTVERLSPIVYEYATALYDGESTDVLNAILRQC